MPTLRKGRALLARGHKVTLLTSKGWVESESGAAGKFSSLVQGMKVVSIDDGMTDNVSADLKSIEEKYGLKAPRSLVWQLIRIWDDAIGAPLEELHAADPIDYALVDYFCVAWMKKLTNMGIDYCINLSTPGAMLWLCRVEGTEDWSWMTMGNRLEFFILHHAVFFHMHQLHRTLASSKPWLVDSFPEADGFVALPAHCRYCGSIADAPSSPALEDKFAALVSRAAKAGRPVICVSLGSMIRPDKVIVNALYQGLAGGPWFVVWSLWPRGVEMLPEVDGEQFLISPWIPQPQILAHPQCKLFVTHGGWGGLMEAAAAGKSVLCLPFFGDQPANALLVERTGWGLRLPHQNFGPFEPVKDPPSWTGKLTADEVRTKVTTIVETPSFQEGAQQMQRGALQYGGAGGAAKQVEEWANLSKQGCLPKPVKATVPGCLPRCAALCR